MYAIRDAEGKFVGRSRSRAGAHRRSRVRGMLGASVNRAGSSDDSLLSMAREAGVAGRRMTGHAPLNEVYHFADRAFMRARGISNDTLGVYITRPRYATLAEMARNAGDLPFSKVGKRSTRLHALEKYGLVRRQRNLHRWELTAAGWNLLNASENAWRLSKEK